MSASSVLMLKNSQRLDHGRIPLAEIALMSAPNHERRDSVLPENRHVISMSTLLSSDAL